MCKEKYPDQSGFCRLGPSICTIPFFVEYTAPMSSFDND